MAKTRTSPRVDERKIILADAEKASSLIISALPYKCKKARSNFEKIHALSKKLLSEPGEMLCPRAETLVRFASVVHLRIKLQTLRNRYRSMIKVWTEAWQKLTMMMLPSELEAQERNLRNVVDRDPKVAVLYDIIRALYNENNQLRRALGDKEPIVTPKEAPTFFAEGQDQGSYVDMRPIREWIQNADLADSFFRVTEVGLKLNQNARPNLTIMNRRVLDALRAL